MLIERMKAISASLLLYSFLLFYNLTMSSSLKRNIDIHNPRNQKMNKVRNLSPSSYPVHHWKPTSALLFIWERKTR